MRLLSILSIAATLSCAVASISPVAAQSQQAPRLQTLTVGPIAVKLPPSWVAESLSSRGQLVSDPASRIWSLEIGGDAIDMVPQRPQPDQLIRLAETTKAKLLAEKGGTVAIRNGEAGEKIVVHDFWTPDASQGKWVRAWHRFAIRGNAVVLADFTFFVDREMADRPEAAAARDAAERLALTAVLRAE